MNLRKIISAGVMTSALVAGLASSAVAVTINWDDDYRTGSGGEFTLVDTGLDLGAYSSSLLTKTSGIIGDDSFQTFCIERNENISKGETVTFGLSGGATNGGSGGPNPDPVSKGTAYLYSLFASGDLADYNYDATGDARKASAGLLQNAIWYLENELTSTPTLNSNIFVVAAVTEFTTLAGAMADAGGAYGVQAVNLEKPNGDVRQDQLYVSVPDGGSTLALLGLAMGSLAFIARRRKA